MGRKIPGKKHRGVKDPDKQRNKRLNSLKNKINAPPTDPDVQEVPHSVNRIAELKEKFKEKKNNKFGINLNSKAIKKKNKSDEQFKFKQGKRESDRQFLDRVTRACNSVIQQSRFEDKYKVQIKRNPKTGEVEEYVKRPDDELELTLKKARNNAKGNKSKKSKKTKDDKPTLTKSQKRRMKLAEKKQKKQLGLNNLDNGTDLVQFGEVVHEPPTLNSPRKVEKTNSVPRPGQKELLLKSLVQNSTKQNYFNTSKNNTQKMDKKKIDKTAKRKSLPNTIRKHLDKQQADVINAYRMLKKANK